MSEQYSDCPICGSVFEADDFETDGEFVWREVRCQNPECGFEYQEVFKFIHNESIGACKELDEFGKEM